MTSKKVAAFFDLDRTLIAVNSGYLYAKHERKNKRITAQQFWISALYIVLYHFSLVDIEAAYRKAALYYTGVPEEDLRQRTHDWFRENIQHLLLPGAKVALEAHREAGHPLVLLTSSSEYVSEIVTESWDLDAWLANHFETDEEGRMTGGVNSPLCYGDGKVVFAEQWAEENGVDLDASYFYSDSYSDRPMLDRVGHPRVVQPDPRLARYARQMNWSVHDWSGTDNAVILDTSANS